MTTELGWQAALAGAEVLAGVEVGAAVTITRVAVGDGVGARVRLMEGEAVVWAVVARAAAQLAFIPLESMRSFNWDV
jgi:hypothetical protein